MRYLGLDAPMSLPALTPVAKTGFLWEVQVSTSMLRESHSRNLGYNTMLPAGFAAHEFLFIAFHNLSCPHAASFPSTQRAIDANAVS